MDRLVGLERSPAAAQAMAAAARRKYKGMNQYMGIGQDTSQRAILDYLDGIAVCVPCQPATARSVFWPYLLLDHVTYFVCGSQRWRAGSWACDTAAVGAAGGVRRNERVRRRSREQGEGGGRGDGAAGVRGQAVSGCDAVFAKFVVSACAEIKCGSSCAATRSTVNVYSKPFYIF